MALSKFSGFNFNHVDQDDTPDYTPEEIKEYFDSRGVDLKTFLDGLIDTLNSTTTGSSGADNIAATAITNLTGSTVQSLLKSIRDNLKSTTGGSSGADFVATSGVTGLTGSTVQAVLGALKTYVDGQVDPTKGALASVGGVSNKAGDISIIGGTGITITPDTTEKKITVNATGEHAPIAHAASHMTGTDKLTHTIDQTKTPADAAVSTELASLLNYIANRLKAISGETNWSDTPATSLKTHLKSVMPHEFKDIKNNKLYKFGLQISSDGNPQIIYEGVD